MTKFIVCPSRWQIHFMRAAREASLLSKDPSTKVGAVLVKLNRIIGSGFNGFPPGIADDDRLYDRNVKLMRIVHAEMNAIFDARHEASGPDGTTLSGMFSQGGAQVPLELTKRT